MAFDADDRGSPNARESRVQCSKAPTPASFRRPSGHVKQDRGVSRRRLIDGSIPVLVAVGLTAGCGGGSGSNTSQTTSASATPTTSSGAGAPTTSTESGMLAAAAIAAAIVAAGLAVRKDRRLPLGEILREQ